MKSSSTYQARPDQLPTSPAEILKWGRCLLRAAVAERIIDLASDASEEEDSNTEARPKRPSEIRVRSLQRRPSGSCLAGDWLTHQLQLRLSVLDACETPHSAWGDLKIGGDLSQWHASAFKKLKRIP